MTGYIDPWVFIDIFSLKIVFCCTADAGAEITSPGRIDEIPKDFSSLGKYFSIGFVSTFHCRELVSYFVMFSRSEIVKAFSLSVIFKNRRGNFLVFSQAVVTEIQSTVKQHGAIVMGRDHEDGF